MGDTIGDPIKGFGTIGLENSALGPGDVEVISRWLLTAVIGVLTIVATIYFLIQIFTGAIAIIGSSGDKGKLEGARKKIQNGILGIVVVVAAIFIADLGGVILGINILGITGQLVNLSP